MIKLGWKKRKSFTFKIQWACSEINYCHIIHMQVESQYTLFYLFRFICYKWNQESSFNSYIDLKYFELLIILIYRTINIILLNLYVTLSALICVTYAKFRKSLNFSMFLIFNYCDLYNSWFRNNIYVILSAQMFGLCIYRSSNCG